MMKQERQVMDSCESYANVVLRPELVTLLNESDKIQRFSGLGLSQQSISLETVKNHTLGLLPRVDQFIFDKDESFWIKKTLLIHDLPETRVLLDKNKRADVTAVEKSLSSRVDLIVESDEMRAARNIFTSDELQLYIEFSEASEFLKGRRQERPTSLGLVTKMLDKTDGDIHFHLAAFSGRYLDQNLNPKAQTMAFEQYGDISKLLKSLKGTSLKEAVILSQRILNEAMLTIRGIWLYTPKIPSLIKKSLDEFVLQE